MGFPSETQPLLKEPHVPYSFGISQQFPELLGLNLRVSAQLQCAGRAKEILYAREKEQGPHKSLGNRAMFIVTSAHIC